MEENNKITEKINNEENNNEPVNENIHTYDNGFHPKEVKLKDNYNFYRKSIGYKIWNRILVLFWKFLLFFPKFFVWGFRFKGRKNKKYIKGSCVICNHIHQFDVFMLFTAMPFKRIYITTLQSNLGFGIVSRLFRDGGAVPIPTDVKLIKKFNKETPEMINKGYNVMFYPEAALMPYCDHIRNFMPGVFHYAYASTKVIVPTCFTFHRPKGWYKLVRKNKPCITYNILEPYYMEDLGNKRKTIEKTKEDLEKIVSDYFIKHSDYYYDKDGNKIEHTNKK